MWLRKKNAVFLTSCGASTYSLPRNQLSPTKLSDVTLAAIFAALGAHFKAKVSKVVASFKFFSKKRHAGEAVGDYKAALNKLVDDCNFGAVRKRMMCDQVVCGTNYAGMQTRLLKSVDLNLETTKNFVMATETARRDSHMLGAPSVSADMVHVSKLRRAAEKEDHGGNVRPVQWQTPDDALPTPQCYLLQVRSEGPPRIGLQDSCE
ncbi:hypothetical protein MRX96_000962 [Rhipicephalus microplus]